jgi:hypothetical protein
MADLHDNALLPFPAAPPPSEGASFDFYSTLAPDLAEEARATAGRIKDRSRASYIDTGNDLIAIKEKLGHGRFGPWLDAEFSMSARQAESFMAAARCAIKYEINAYLPATVLISLAAPGVSPEIF